MGDLGKMPEGQASQHLQPSQQLLQQQETKWFQRCHDKIMELEAQFGLESQKREEEWYERYEKKDEEILEKSAEISTLIVGPSPQFFCYF